MVAAGTKADDAKAKKEAKKEAEEKAKVRKSTSLFFYIACEDL